MTISVQEAGSYIGRNLYSIGDGDKIGKIGQVYLDDSSGQPEWVTVSTGLFGTKETFVPISDATPHDDGLGVPFTKSQVKDAPNVDPDDGHLSPQEEEQLYRHYGREYGTYGDTDDDQTTQASTSQVGTVQTGTDSDFDGTADRGYTDTSGTTSGTDQSLTDVGTGRADADIEPGEGAMTRSEERLNVGTEQVATGRARLRKWVETETQSVQVPVRKEKVRLETEPVTEANAGDALSGAEISEGEHEVTLTEERPVVTTEAVPVERVRLETDVVEETRTVEGEVRKERIDLDADETVRDRG